MPDQREKAGNIGDVFKHALLPELVLTWLETQPADPAFVETHAGWWEHRLERPLTGERAWSLALVEAGIRDAVYAGLWADVLRETLPQDRLPGSMQVVQRVLSRAGISIPIRGFDFEPAQVESFPQGVGDLAVMLGDGYAGASHVTFGSPLVLCDPFWNEKEEVERVRRLLSKLERVVVWYPTTMRTEEFRAWLRSGPLPYIEFEFRDRRMPPWAGTDLPGAGLAVKGVAIDRAVKAAHALLPLFRGREHEGRDLSPRLTTSRA